MKLSHVICLTGCLLLASSTAFAQASQRQMMHPDAPPETALLSQLFGDWDAYSVSRNQDGTWSSDTTHAEWRWYAILDGHAIQDDWIKFETAEDSAPVPKVTGTNIRIYNPKTAQWNMAWIDSNNRNLATFTAENVDNTVVMSGKNATGRDVRIIFYDISADEFHWRQEWTFDDGENWLVVAKILCKRKS